MESKTLNDLRQIIRRSMSDIVFCDQDILDLEDNFRLIHKIPKGGKLSETLRQMRRDLIDFRRRNYIKTVFSSFEAIIWGMKNILLEQKQLIKAPKLLIELQGFKLEGPNKKNLTKKPMKTGLEKSIKVTINAFDTFILKGKSHNIFSSDEWEKFKNAIKIRDRITHPKSPKDLKVSVKELELVRDCYYWFFNLTAIKRIPKSL